MSQVHRGPQDIDPHFCAKCGVADDHSLRGLVIAYIKAYRGTETHYSYDEETEAFVKMADAVGLGLGLKS